MDMEENVPENEPAETPTESGAEATPAAAPEAPAVAEPAAPAPPTVRLRDRVWSFRSILAVGIASLLLGGAGGAGIVAATDGHGHGDRFSRFGFGPDGGRGGMRFHRPGGGYGFNGGGPGGLYPPVAPQQNGQPGPGSAPTPSAPAG